MRFRKIRIESTPGNTGPVERWQMLIKTTEELMKYMDVEAGAYTRTLMSMRRDKDGNIMMDHLSGAREVMLATTIESKIHSAKPGEQVWPHQVLSEAIGLKGGGMLRCIQRGHEIAMNEMGGYSDVKSFDEIWNVEVLEYLEKEGVEFPSDKDPIVAEILILENDVRISNTFERQIKGLFGIDDMVTVFGREKEKSRIARITSLKDRDPQWVFASIENCRNIAFQTEALDDLQIDRFMKMFTKLETKRIIIKTTNREAIESHPLFQANRDKHIIEFI